MKAKFTKQPIDPSIKERFGIELIQIGNGSFEFQYKGMWRQVISVLDNKWMFIVNNKVIQERADSVEDAIEKAFKLL